MSEIIPFVTVKNAVEAIEFYKYVFNAELQGEITWLKNIGGFEGPEYEGKVGHSTLKFGESRIFLNDWLEKYPYEFGEHIQLVYNFEDEKSLKEAFKKLSEEGKVVQELQEVFWGALFGTVKDKYNVTWQVYYGHK